MTAGLRGLLTEKTSAVLTLGYVNGFYSNGSLDDRVPGKHLPGPGVHRPADAAEPCGGRVPSRLHQRRHLQLRVPRDRLRLLRPADCRAARRSICRAATPICRTRAQTGDPTQQGRVDNFFQVGASLDYFLRNWAYLGVGYALLDNRSNIPIDELPEAAGVCAPGRHVLVYAVRCPRAVVRPWLAVCLGRAGQPWRVLSHAQARLHRERRGRRAPKIASASTTPSTSASTAKRSCRACFGSRPTEPSTTRWPGALQVAGLRTGEIQELLVSKLKDKYLKEPQVVVTIKDRNSQKISVLGQVTQAGSGRLLPEHDDRRRHRQRRRVHRHRGQELGQPAAAGRPARSRCTSFRSPTSAKGALPT